MAEMLDELPTQFNDATNRTIELIDVLWLNSNTILAAFEIEATTSIYSGLLPMSDLLALQPNLDLALFLVAPDERRAKVRQEIKRPTFAYREKALPKVLRKPLTTCARFSNNGEPWTTSFAPPVGTFLPALPLLVLACSLPVALSPLRTPGRV